MVQDASKPHLGAISHPFWEQIPSILEHFRIEIETVFERLSITLGIQEPAAQWPGPAECAERLESAAPGLPGSCRVGQYCRDPAENCFLEACAFRWAPPSAAGVRPCIMPAHYFSALSLCLFLLVSFLPSKKGRLTTTGDPKGV